LLHARARTIVVGNPFGRGLNERISYRFHARDLQFVMGQAPRDVLVRFRVLLDG